MANDKELTLRGRRLKALVTAAEAPVTGDVVKKGLFKDLSLDDLLKLDLREQDPAPASLPRLPHQDRT